MREIHVGVNLHETDDFRAAILPLLEADEIDLLEYSFDTSPESGSPEWAAALLDYYATERNLVGHGVTFSILSAEWTDGQQRWLERMATELTRRKHTHFSEHFGFLRAGNFHDATPLPVPMSETTLRIGRDRLKRLADVAQMPVGLENLAFAFCADDVAQQGEFIDKLLQPVDGFVLLDAHNLYCQSVNFNRSAERLLDGYPLERVRELHVSGGSWDTVQGSAYRRDNHDSDVPEEVFAIVASALKRCPHVRSIIFERMGGTINSDTARAQLAADFRRLKTMARETSHGN